MRMEKAGRLLLYRPLRNLPCPFLNALIRSFVDVNAPTNWDFGRTHNAGVSFNTWHTRKEGDIDCGDLFEKSSLVTVVKKGS